MPSQENQPFTAIEDVPELQKRPVKPIRRNKTTWGIAVLAATMGVMFFSISHFNIAAKPDSTQVVAPLIEPPISRVAYFPSLYVNQAKEIEQALPTF